MRAVRVLAAAALAAAIALPSTASAGICTIWWRDVTVGPATVRTPYCIW